MRSAAIRWPRAVGDRSVGHLVVSAWRKIVMVYPGAEVPSLPVERRFFGVASSNYAPPNFAVWMITKFFAGSHLTVAPSFSAM